MKKGIKFRKLKRKARNIVLWTITYLMLSATTLSFFGFAFGNHPKIYAVIFTIGCAWCLLFTKANSKERRHER